MHLRHLTLLLLFVTLTICAVEAQESRNPSTQKSATNDEPWSSFQAINATVDTILMQYEQLTGKVLIKDSNLAANALPITISVPQPVRKSELVRLIEASLLLNNIVLVPSQEANTVKVININTGKNPRSEGVRLYTGPESIPDGEQVISYYMPFKYISASEALTVFQTHILPRAYTSFVPINSAQALLITESRQGMTQLNQCFFRRTLQLFSQSKQIGYADTLNDTDIDLPRQHFGAFILQKLLELMHEHDKIQRIEPGFDEVVRLHPCQVVPGLHFVERRLHA